jgi:hypothetical protein
MTVLNWKGCGRKLSWPNLRYYFSGKTEGNHEISVKVTVFQAEIEPGTCTVRSRSANYSTTTFGFAWLCSGIEAGSFPILQVSWSVQIIRHLNREWSLITVGVLKLKPLVGLLFVSLFQDAVLFSNFNSTLCFGYSRVSLCYILKNSEGRKEITVMKRRDKRFFST